ncbi:MAG: PAS domain-containing protein [Thermodesulfobacteriota bacterium]
MADGRKTRKSTLALSCLQELLQSPEPGQAASLSSWDCIMDAVSDVVLSSDPKGRISYANPSAIRKLGYSRKELLGKPICDLVAPDFQEIFKSSIAAAAGSPEAGSAIRFIHKKGHGVNLEVKPRLYSCHAMQYCVIVGRDLAPAADAGPPSNEPLAILEAILQHAPLPIFVNTVEGVYRMVNPAWEHLTGKPAGDVLGRSSQELFSPDTAQFFQQVIRQVARTGESVAFEETAMIRGEQKHYNTVSFPIRDPQGQVEAVGGVCVDITDLKTIQAALGDHVATLQALFLNHPESLFLLDDQGTVLVASQVAAQRLGLTLDKLVGTIAYDHFPPDLARKRRDLNKQVMATGQAMHFEERRDQFWFDTQFIPLTDGTGKVTKLLVLAVDITARRLAEQALRESEDRFRTLTENSLAGVYLIQDGKFRYVNPVLARIFGYNQSDLIDRMSPMDLVHPEDRPRIASEIKHRLQGELPAGTNVFRGLRRDGSTITCEVLSRRLEYQERPAVMGTLLDITERRRAEAAQQEAEQQFRAIFDHATDGILIADPETRQFHLGNPMIARMLGYTQEELQHLRIEDIHPSASQPYVLDQFERHLRGELIVAPDMPVLRKDGSVFYADISASHIMIRGKLYPAGIFRDITARKQAEEALQIQARALENMAEAVHVTDELGTIVFANPAAHAMFGYPEGELTGRHVSELNDLSPAENERLVSNIIQQLEQEGSWVGEFRNRKKDGTAFITQARISALKLPEKSLWISVQEDITQRQQATRALAIQAQLLDVALDSIIAHDLDGTIIYVNQTGCQERGYTKAEMLGKRITDFVAPGRPVLQSERRLGQNLQEPLGFESVHRRKDGSTFPVEVRGRLAQVDGNVFYLGVARDITQRKKIEEALRSSEHNYRTLVEHAQAFILRLNAQGNITFANKFAQEFSGHPEGYIIGRHIIGTILPATDSQGFNLAAKVRDLIRDPRRHWSSWTEAVRQDGTKRWIEWNFGALYNEEGRLAEILCVGIDRTERKQAEIALQLFSQILDKQVENRTAELEAMRAQTQYIIDTTPAVILTADITPPHRLTFVSDYLRHLGSDPGDFLGTPLFDPIRVHPDDQLRLTLAQDILFDNGQVVAEYRLQKQDGAYYWIQINAKVVKNETGVPVEIVACFTDLSYQKALEQRLEILRGPIGNLKVWKTSDPTLKNLAPALLPQSWNRVQECLQAGLQGETITGVPLALQDKSGGLMQGRLTTAPLKLEGDNLHRAVGAIIELWHDKKGLH